MQDIHETQFFTALAGVVLVALLSGALASTLTSVLRVLGACIVLSALLACGVLILIRDTDTQGFAALLVIGTFMFCNVIAFSSALALRRLRLARTDGARG